MREALEAVEVPAKCYGKLGAMRLSRAQLTKLSAMCQLLQCTRGASLTDRRNAVSATVFPKCVIDALSMTVSLAKISHASTAMWVKGMLSCMTYVSRFKRSFLQARPITQVMWCTERLAPVTIHTRAFFPVVCLRYGCHHPV